MKKYGKPFADVLSHKDAFFSKNAQNLKHTKEMFQFYTKQPKRIACKNCAAPLSKVAFKKMGVDYLACTVCEHINGAHEDTDTFCAKLYTEDEGKDYGSNYSAESKQAYSKRVLDIYQPKVTFLKDSFMEIGLKPETLKFVDIGAGSGYFVHALKEGGLNQSLGYEVSRSQVELGNSMSGEGSVIWHDPSETMNIVKGLDADVVTMIGVLEHVQKPREILSAIANNSKIKYFYFSVPLFSVSVFIETAFSDDLSPRHLSPPHTHLYTEASINHFCKEFKLEKVSEWWFGSDMIDLYRSIWVRLGQDESNQPMQKMWEEKLKPLIDDLQIAQDKRHASSEVHMLLKCRP